MNIFVLDLDPVIAAQSQANKHVIKMILESAQLLCAHFEPGTAPYKRTHFNHPCAVWTRESKYNYEWLLKHAFALSDEYTYRYGKTHKSKAVIKWCSENYLHTLPDIKMTNFAQAMPDKYKNPNVVRAYRGYYIEEKKHILDYTKRQPPVWLNIK